MSVKQEDLQLTSILDNLKREGFIVINNFINDEDLLNIQNEFKFLHDQAKNHSDNYDFEIDEISCFNVRVDKKKLLNLNMPVTHSIFYSSKLKNISEKYFKSKNIFFNEEVFFCEHQPSDERLNVLPYVFHFDKSNTLKFFLYIEDSDEDCGPLEVVSRTHKKNKKTRLKHLKNLNDLDNVLHEKSISNNYEILNAKAGAMVIFDTDITHRAGFVKHGKTRKVIRGHTRLKARKTLFDHLF